MLLLLAAELTVTEWSNNLVATGRRPLQLPSPLVRGFKACQAGSTAE